MAENRPYIAENATERERLRALVAKLTDEDLTRSLADGWTTATLLAHMAFWDQRQRILLEKWKQGGVNPSPVPSPQYIDTINEAVRTICNAIQPRTAAQLAVDAAEAIDLELEKIGPDFMQEIESLGNERFLRRALHRLEHLDQIDKALGL